MRHGDDGIKIIFLMSSDMTAHDRMRDFEIPHAVMMTGYQHKKNFKTRINGLMRAKNS